MHLEKNAPKPMRVFAIVCGVYLILAEGNWIWKLRRNLIDANRNSKVRQCRHDVAIELGNRLRLKSNLAKSTTAREYRKHVIDEVEFKSKEAILIGDKR